MSNLFYLNKKSGFRLAGVAALVFLFLWVFISPVVLAGVFTWKDETGKTHFTDDVHKIPEKYRDSGKGFKKLKNARPPSSAPLRSLETPSVEIPSRTSYSPSGGGKSHVIPLISTAGGNFMVEVVLNGRVKAMLMVDTGASIVTISEEIARKIGHRNSYNSPEMPFTTAGGMVWMPMIALDKVTVGDAMVKLVEASVNNKMGDLDGLLGMSFLGDFRVEMDRTRSQMILKPLDEPGARTWNGKSALWWKSRFSDYAKKIKDYEVEAAKLDLIQHPKAGKVDKMVDFYKDMQSKLDQEASRAGVPQSFRSPEL